jgi:predicted PurR-regulated permease PerM
LNVLDWCELEIFKTTGGGMPMILFYKKYWRTAMDIAFIALTIYLLMVSFRFVYEIAAPILLAFVLFWITEPFSRFLHRRKIKKTIAAALSMATFLF